MSRRFENAQLTNAATLTSIRNQCLSLAMNVFEFRGLNKFIDIRYMNYNLLHKGSIAFFYDEDLGGLVCLPYQVLGKRDIYNRPKKIQVFSPSGYRRTLTNSADKKEFVIMYDNNGYQSLVFDILQICRRLSIITRVMDTNIMQQKTPRQWKVPRGQEQTFKKIINDIDGDVDVITTYDGTNGSGIALDEITMTLAPSPYVTDKLQDQKDKLWSEFLRLIGVSNLSLTKKERHITDEITAMQGGTIASRYNRYLPRKKL